VVSGLEAIRAAGNLRGRHYTTYVDEVIQLKRAGKVSEAIRLLKGLVGATESESEAAKVAGLEWGVAPWYYEQLEIIYRKEKDGAAEVAILERYMKMPHAPGVGPGTLAARLQKLKK
jgi:hypothetical protein